MKQADINRAVSISKSCKPNLYLSKSENYPYFWKSNPNICTKMKKLVTLLLLLCPLLAMAQPYTLKHLGLPEGLSNNFVVSATQDRQGFLWFATEEGLNKFDGTRFITYYKNSAQKQSITGNELNRVYADPTDPIIWIATQRAGLNAYNYETDSFTVYQNDPDNPHSLITNDVTDITSAADGNLWVSTYYAGVEYFDKKTGQFTHYNKETVPGLPTSHVWTITDTGDGNLYIGQVHNGLSVLSLRDKTVRHFLSVAGQPNSLPGNEVMCIFKDSNSNIWLGTNNGLALFNAEAGEFITFRNNKSDHFKALSGNIWAIRQFGNKLWIGTEFNGIAILDLSQRTFAMPDEFRFQFIREGDDAYSLSGSSVRCLFQDSFKNIWIGTWQGGVNFIANEPGLFSNWVYSPIPNNEHSLSHKVASSLCVDHSGRVWIGTDGGGINVFEEGRRTAIYSKEKGQLSDNSVLSALCDSEGNLWFGTFQGSVNYYDVRKKAFRQIAPLGEKTLDVRCFFEDARQNIWIGSSNGLYKIPLHAPSNVKHYHTGNSSLPDNLVRSIGMDAKGQLWIGTFGGGVAVFSPDMKLLERFAAYNGFSSNTINQIFQDSRHRMWIATGEGLACFPPTDSFQYAIYQHKEGVSNTHIRAISEDKNGKIWVSTNAGISGFSETKKEFSNYGHFDNVPMESFLSGSVAQDRNGAIYFGSTNGVCYFNPDNFTHERPTPPIAITEMKIFDRLGKENDNETLLPLRKNREVELPHTQNSFGITFNTLNYAMANQVEYAYKLKGLEDSWYTVNKENKVTFRNIPPGRYEFQLKARIRNQEWSDHISKLSINIHPPVWLTWWAKTIYMLASLSLLYFILYSYKRKLIVESLYKVEKEKHEQEQELNNERLRFYTNITHELRTPLTLIVGPLEDIQKDKSLSSKQLQKISVIHQSAQRLLNLINQILEFRKTETQNKKLCVSKRNITALVYEIGLKYKELNQKPGIELSIKAEVEDLPIFFDKEIMTIVLDNLISNAIKYTDKGKITLCVYNTIKENVAYTEICVSDTGYGISPEALPQIFDRYYQERSNHQASGTGIGLSLVKNLVMLHEGEIWVESTVNQGSSFYVSLLTDNTYPNALHDDSNSISEPEEEKEQQPEEVPTSGKRMVLVVEDNKDIRDYIADALSEHFEVLTSINGEEGLQLAFAKTPDIVVSDIMMPVMSGTDLCQSLKKDVRTSHIPVILLTAKDTLEDKEEGYRVGADSYLTKPFSATLLHSRINNLLESRQKLAEQFKVPTALDEKRAAMTDALNQLDKEFIEKVTQLIEARLSSDKIDITYLSDKMCMSGSTLYRKMKALTGLSTNEFIRKVKMKNAEKLLLEGKYTILEVAFKVGVNSASHFRQYFKDEFGVLPSDYLKRIKE